MRKLKLLAAFAISSFAITSCNSEGDSKEVKKDSTVIKTDTMVPIPPKDTVVMDTNAVKKMTDKPIVPSGRTSGQEPKKIIFPTS